MISVVIAENSKFENITLEGIVNSETGYNMAKDPLPLQFSNPTIGIKPFYRIYSKDLQRIIYTSSPPSEGYPVALWFNLISHQEDLNLSHKIFVVTYTIDPNGQLGNTYSTRFPIEYESGNYFKDIPYESNRGLDIDTNVPGIWKVKYLAFNEQEYNKFNNLTDTQKINYKGFENYDVHVLTYYEHVTEEVSRNALYVSIFALFAAIIMGILPFYRDYKKQVSLLESLYSELDAISSKEKKINLLNKEISTKGNLQWVEELFGWDLKPAHGIWKLNTQIYVDGLNEKIKFKKTKHLKNALIHISQKIELIENYLSQYNQVSEKNKEYRKNVKEAITKVLKEVIELVETTKKYIELEFGINKKCNSLAF